MRKNTSVFHTQEKIIEEAKKGNLKNKTLKEMAEIIGINTPQTVLHHLRKLQEKGFIYYDKHNKEVVPIETNKKSPLLSIPIYGSANAGPASYFANEEILGYLRLDKRLIKGKNESDIFALKVVGDSMNNKIMSGGCIENGNYVVVEKDADINNGDVVVSVLENNTVNIKEVRVNKDYISLVSHSRAKQKYPPIIIKEFDEHIIAGKVILNIQ